MNKFKSDIKSILQYYDITSAGKMAEISYLDDTQLVFFLFLAVSKLITDKSQNING